MLCKSKIKWAALFGIVLSALSLVAHLLLARYSGRDLVYGSPIFTIHPWRPDFDRRALLSSTSQYRKLWGPVKPLESLHPYVNPRGKYPVPSLQSNGYIFVKIQGSFHEIRSLICDVVAVSRLLNATLVIPELQEATSTKGIRFSIQFASSEGCLSVFSKFKSFGYLYNEDQFIAALANDVLVVKSLPKRFKVARKNTEIPVFTPAYLASPNYYLEKVLPKLKQQGVVELLVSGGGCLQALLPPNLAEYQRLRCRVAFHALRFRQEVQELGSRIVQRLQASGRPYLAFHTGLDRDALAYHGCAERFQDVHSELIQYRRSWMIKRGIVQGELSVDSEAQRFNGSCPLMPEEVGILLRAIGYPPDTVIYLSGAEIFGGQRLLIPLRAMFNNLVDRASLCTVKELTMIYGPEDPFPSSSPPPPPLDSEKDRLVAWKNAGPRPRPLPPPAARPKYPYNVEGWWGWVTETNREPKPTISDLRARAHKLLWEALDYIVCVEADVFFPGFDRDGNGRPNFASLVMGHRVYESASLKTYRPDRKVIVKLLEDIRDHIYKPNHTWLVSVRKHLNKTVREEGLIDMSLNAKPSCFLSHPLPECSCRTDKVPEASLRHKAFVKDPHGRDIYGGEDDCPAWMNSRVMVPSEKERDDEEEEDETEKSLGQVSYEISSEIDAEEKGSKSEELQSTEQEEELDAND